MSEKWVFIGGEDSKISHIRFMGVHVEIEKKTRYAGGAYDLRPSDTVGLLSADTYGFHIANAQAVSMQDCSVKWGKEKAPHFKHAIYAFSTSDLHIENFVGE